MQNTIVSFIVLFGVIVLIAIFLKKGPFISKTSSFPRSYVGLMIGALITLLLWCGYLLLIANQQYEGRDFIGWLAFLLGLPTTLLYGPISQVITNLFRINPHDVFSMLIFVLINWSIIGYLITRPLKH